MTSPARRRTARRGKAHSLAAACSRRCPDRYWNLASIAPYLRSPYARAGSLRQKKIPPPRAKKFPRSIKEIPQRRFLCEENRRRGDCLRHAGRELERRDVRRPVPFAAAL